jgi:hypothetical protein
MASTFSPTLRLELIGDGDQSGIWGQTTNNNLGGLLEQAIGGVVTITLIDANYTLTNFNGVVDEARNAVIIATGALSAQRNIIAPLVEKTYTIRNSTSGGFGVQIIGSSGTGVIIPNGTTASVFCDGTNFFPATTGSLGNQSINGNLLVTGTTTLVGALGGSTATFSGAISSVNPTFTGTPTAPTAISGTNTTQIATTAFVQNVAGALGTMSTQNANAVAITGGTINSVAMGSAVTGATQAVTTNNTSLATTAFVRSIIPAGVILMWSGSIASIPSGWVLCDGANGTPNLRDRFIVGAGSTYGVGATGGSADATLPSHTHSLSASGTTTTADISHIHSGTTLGMNVNASHTHTITDPGHIHPVRTFQGNNGSGVANVGQDAGPFILNNAITSAVTGITGTNATNIDHLHNFNTGAMSANSTHNHTVTVTGTSGSAGSSGTNANLPPYYALAYIMKT